MQDIEAERDVKFPSGHGVASGRATSNVMLPQPSALAFSRAIEIISPDRSVAMMRPTDDKSLSAVVPVPHPNSNAVSSPLR